MENSKLVISSRQNSSVQLCFDLLSSFPNKEKKQYFIAEGFKLIKTLMPKYKPFLLLTSERFWPELSGLGEESDKIQIVSDKLWTSLNQNLLSPSKLIGIFPKPITEFTSGTELKNGFYLILDRIQDPGNMGSLLRTAAAANWQNIISLKGSVDIFSPKVIRSCAGSIAHLNIINNLELETLTKILTSPQNNFGVICSSSHAKKEINQINLKTNNNSKTALILGNEGGGINEELMSLPNTELVKISINERIESLNVSVAGALLMFKLSNLI